MDAMKPAIFLDRDGVLIEEKGWITSPEEVRWIPEIFPALLKLQSHGFELFVATNQTGIAKGFYDAVRLGEIHHFMDEKLRREGVTIRQYYFCPHHPHADLIDFRVDCECRKPKPGMLLRAQKDWNIDLKKSYMIGDRISDVWAGKRAGTYTVQVKSGHHLAPPITGVPEEKIEPDFWANTLFDAADWITHKL